MYDKTMVTNNIMSTINVKLFWSIKNVKENIFEC